MTLLPFPFERHIQENRIGMDIQLHSILKSKGITEVEGILLALPLKPLDPVFTKCLKHDSPCLWEACSSFYESPSWESWESLSDFIVPWSGSYAGKTVWLLCEELAKSRDGMCRGLDGRYREGVFPSLSDVRTVLSVTHDDKNEGVKISS